jgi:putative salt-induced outer membrane protein
MRITKVTIPGCLLYASAIFALALPQDAAAHEQVPEDATVISAATAPTSTWGGEAEAGVLLTGGNTETESINTKLKIENEGDHWRHSLNAEYFKSSDSNVTTAERKVATFKSEYKLNVSNYLFAVIRYDSDRFSGYRDQASESAGYGRRKPFGTHTKVEMEAGVGGRQTHYVDGTRKEVAILRLAAKYIHELGRTSVIREEAFTEIAEDNTHTESVTSIKTRMNGNLSMKIAFTWTHNSYVPQDIKKTDTITSVTLVYDL